MDDEKKHYLCQAQRTELSIPHSPEEGKSWHVHFYPKFPPYVCPDSCESLVVVCVFLLACKMALNNRSWKMGFPSFYLISIHL